MQEKPALRRKKIYEGDIVRQNIKNRPEFQSKLNWVVDFSDDRASFSMTSGGCFMTFEDCLKDNDVEWEVEIIGNIYETPELIYKREKDLSNAI